MRFTSLILLSTCLTILFVVSFVHGQQTQTFLKPNQSGDFRVSSVEQGFAGEWSDGASWLTIIKDRDKISGIYLSDKGPQVMRGELLANKQLKLKNNSYGEFFDPFDDYEGDFDKEAWLELGADGSFLTVRFSQAKGGRSLVMKRTKEANTFQVAEASTVIWALVSSGFNYTCAVTTSATLYCWGFGHGNILPSEVFGSPGLVEIIGDMSIESVSAGEAHTCATMKSGAAYCWGAGSSGELGNRAGTESAVPVLVAGRLTFSVVSVGIQYTCGLTTSGEAYCWGSNSYYDQLGNGNGLREATLTDVSAYNGSLIPLPVAGGLRFATLSTGKEHTCAVTTDGVAYCWGNGTNGQLGNVIESGTRLFGKSSSVPLAVAGGLNFKSVTASKWENFTCGLTTSGSAYCWGLVKDRDDWQLGNGKIGSSSVPVAVAGGLSFISLSAGASHVCGVTNSGAVYCWGYGGSGRLGTGTTKNALTPVPVASALKFAAISSGSSHTCGVTTSGALYCWGANKYGALGDGTTEDRFVPVAVRMQADEDGFQAFIREFRSAVRKRDRVALELMMAPKIVFPVDVRSPSMAFDYLDYNNGEGWKRLEESVNGSTKPYKDSGPRPVARITNDKLVIFGRGADGKWRWLRFGY